MSPAISLFVIAGLEAWGARHVGPLFAAFLYWCAASTAWVGLAYVARRPGWLGKLRWPRLSMGLLLPYMLVAQSTARIARKLFQPTQNEVVPGLWISAWPIHGAPELAVLDLTAELPRRGTSRAYACVPMLDGEAPHPDALQAAVTQAVAWRQAGLPVLVHCAYGHGRSAMVVVGVLLTERKVQSWEEGVALVKAVRPRAGVRGRQRAVMEAWARRLI